MDMKKIITCAALLAGIVFFNGRLNAQVESDIVGYTTVTMEADSWYILGNPFTPLDDSETFKINDVFAGEGFAANDVLYVLGADGAFTPHYWNTTKGGWSTHKVLWRENTTPFATSTAVYLHKATAGEMIFAGKVSSTAVEVGADAGNAWSLTSFVCPADKTLSEYTWTGFASGDMLYTMDSAGAFTPHYWNATKSGWSTHKVMWRENTAKLPIGQAVYMFKKSTGVGSISQN